MQISESKAQLNEKYNFSIDLKETIIRRNLNESYKVIKLTLHKYSKQIDTSISFVLLPKKDEFYVVMSSIPKYSVTISDGLYSITSEISVDPYYEAILPLNAFEKFKKSATIYGPSGFLYEIENVADLVIKPLDSSSVDLKAKPLLNNLKAFNGRPPDSFVKKVSQKYSDLPALYKKLDVKFIKMPQIWNDEKAYIFNCLELKINDSIKEKLSKSDSNYFFVYIENEAEIVKSCFVKITENNCLLAFFLIDEFERFDGKVIITYCFQDQVLGRIESVKPLRSNKNMENTSQDIPLADIKWYRSLRKK